VSCCCCSDTCSLCCSCLPAVKQSTSTRMMYALFLLCAVFLCCVMLSPEVETMMAALVSIDVQYYYFITYAPYSNFSSAVTRIFIILHNLDIPFFIYGQSVFRSTHRQSRPNKDGLKCLSIHLSIHTCVCTCVCISVHRKFL